MFLRGPTGEKLGMPPNLPPAEPLQVEVTCSHTLNIVGCMLAVALKKTFVIKVLIYLSTPTQGLTSALYYFDFKIRINRVAFFVCLVTTIDYILRKSQVFA